MFATVARDLCISFEEVGNMLWADYLDLADSWADTPPLHFVVASFAGVEPKKKGSAKFEASQQSEIRAFAALAKKAAHGNS